MYLISQESPLHLVSDLTKFHILISTVHAKSACVGLLYNRKSNVAVYIRKNTYNLLQNNVPFISHTQEGEISDYELLS